MISDGVKPGGETVQEGDADTEADERNDDDQEADHRLILPSPAVLR